MKKILLGAVLLAALPSLSKAQSFEIGAKAALNFANFSSDLSTYKPDNSTGYQIGLYSRVGLIGFYLQPELYLAKKETESLDVPILLGKKFGLGNLGVRVNAGPVFSFNFKNEDGNINISEVKDVNNYNKSSYTSIAAGAGVDAGKLRFDARYELGVSDLKSFDADVKVNTFSIGVGYRLF